MMKKVGYNRSWDAAPSFAPKRCSSCPRLETILEEGSEHNAVSISSKKLLLLSVVLSMVFYFLLTRTPPFLLEPSTFSPNERF
ncbi:LEM3 (ligand-effect modulator 3) family protein / CDC50 family protein isoform 1 [Hibiscus syriacus]|uniref:LEM3 (Ligand-effect modulator 3) family protein / CDC50 family protein isoform 1 n=1 Tax=Hibiscus syriacus TaxID=106335 RepID=A0A6A3BFG0_HIBSY|nr:LEM3 (ligand-effect modulator 3) family protein / CDC50 family protein isoform 1 [Hibiscus syriacus]